MVFKIGNSLHEKRKFVQTACYKAGLVAGRSSTRPVWAVTKKFTRCFGGFGKTPIAECLTKILA